MMFGIRQGAEVLVIKDGKEWYGHNFQKHITQKFNVFDTHELTIDPSGIGKFACTPGPVTVGSAYASAGYFGFNRDGFTMLADPADMEYDGHAMTFPTRTDAPQEA